MGWRMGKGVVLRQRLSAESVTGRVPKKEEDGDPETFRSFLRFPPKERFHWPTVQRVVRTVVFVLIVMLIFSCMMWFVDTCFMKLYRAMHQMR